jgi:hypothetical protein
MACSAGVSRETGRNAVVHRIGQGAYGMQRGSEQTSRQALSAHASEWTHGREAGASCQAVARTHSYVAGRIRASPVPLCDAAHVMQPWPCNRPSAQLKLRSSQHPWCGPSVAGLQYAPPTQLALAESVRSRGLPHHRHHHPWQHRGFHGTRRAPHRRPTASIDCYAGEDQPPTLLRSMRTPVLTRFAATRQPPGEWADPPTNWWTREPALVHTTRRTRWMSTLARRAGVKLQQLAARMNWDSDSNQRAGRLSVLPVQRRRADHGVAPSPAAG